MGRVLEGAAPVGGRRLAEQQPAGRQQPVDLVDQRDLVRDVLEEVHGPDDPRGSVGQVDPGGKAGDDVDAGTGMLVHPEVAVRLVVRGAEVERQQVRAGRPGQRVSLDVAVVQRDGLGLDEGVGTGVPLSVGAVHPLQVQAVVDQVEVAEAVELAHQVLVIEHRARLVVPARLLVGGPGEGADVVGGEPDVGDVMRGRRERHRVLHVSPVDHGLPVDPA
ncbi:MAG TPA: hypothetical protein VMG13_22935 [Trebonia sp.]|nr:hypothetical protein [Trebonia sp.]